jgi:hypothetical protein
MVAETTPSPQAIPALPCASLAAHRHMLPICVTLDIAGRKGLSSLLDSLGGQAVNSNAREALRKACFRAALSLLNLCMYARGIVVACLVVHAELGAPQGELE